MIAALLASLAGSLAAAAPVPVDPPAPAWDLARVLEAVRTASPEVRAARARGRAGEAAGSAARGALSPRVSFRAGLTRSDDPALLFSQRLWQGRFTSDDFAVDALNAPGPRNAVEYGFVVEQPLWNGGAEVTALSMANRSRREASATARAAVADALLDAVTRYVAYIGARERAAADSVALDAAYAAHTSAVERNRLGQIPNLDTLRTYAHAAEALEQRLTSVRDRESSLRRLSDAVGKPLSEGVVANPEALDPASFVREGENDPPALESARARADRMSLDATRAALRLLPSLNGRFAVSYYRDPDAGSDAERRWFAGLSLDWPLWDGAQRWNDRRAAAAQAEGARAEYESLRLEAASRAETARRDLEIAGPRRDASRAARLASDEALRLATARYRAGLLPLDDLLSVDADAARARERHIAREADLELAGYRYLHAIGRLR